MEDAQLPSGLLEICVLVGPPTDEIRQIDKVAQKGIRSLQVLEPEITSVFVPPFVPKEEAQSSSAVQSSYQRVARRRSFRKKKERPKVESGSGNNVDHRETTTEEISVPKDIDLIGLPQLCFPGGLQVTLEPIEEHFHFLIFTDVLGNRTYGVVAQFSRSVQDALGLSGGQAYWDSSIGSNKTYEAYVPFAICVISRYPYYNALKDCLSCLLPQLKSIRNVNLDERIKEFAAKLALIPCPPPGPLHLVFSMKPLQIVFPSREDLESPVIDLDLHLPFLCFSPKQVLQIMACILTEQRIVFFSSDFALLTLLAECFMVYLHPIKWQHTFVPILSHHMLDFIMAPTSFLMGCHLDHYKEVCKEGDDLILIDIDNGNISFSGNEIESEVCDVPDMPVAAAETFIYSMENLQLHYDLEQSHRATVLDIGEQRLRRRLWQQNLNSEIQEIALQLIVDIFRDVKAHLNYEHRVFNSREFLKTRSPGDQAFYRNVLDTYTFNSFLKARLSKKMDDYTRMELSTSSEIDGRSTMFSESPRRHATEKLKRFRTEYMFSKKLVISMPNLQTIKMADVPAGPLSLRRPQQENGYNVTGKEVHTFRVPEVDFPLSARCIQTYYTDFTNYLSKEIKALPPESSTLLARYYYLRGLVGLMQGKLLGALSDFQKLYKTDLRIFPMELVRKVTLSLPAAERKRADCRPELKKLIGQVMDKEREVPRADERVKKFELPKTHLHMEDFVRRIQESGIVRDTDTIHRLFDALTVGYQKQIDPEIFRDFYNCWKETEAEAEEVDLPSGVAEKLDQNEFVYKLSSSVKTNLGVGKIAMTQKRLFLLIEGRQSYEEIAIFRNIEDVKISTSAFLLLRIQTLRIKASTRKDVFEANLKSECELWQLMIKEMWAGRNMADSHKDPQYVQEALTNVLLMNAVVGALQTAKSIYAASKLSYFDKMRNEVSTIPMTTAETLKHRINPCAGETVPQAVDVLLYTPGQLDASLRDDCPKLWCALGEGKVVIFNASTWSIQHHCLKVGNTKLRCMVGVEQSQVWIGSSDSMIYIINTHSMFCNKQLNDHQGELVDIVMDSSDNQKRAAYSCSADGEVIVWDVNTLKIQHKFQLQYQDITSMKMHNDLLLYCTKDLVLVTNKRKEYCLKLELMGNMQKIISAFYSIQLFPEKSQLWVSCKGGNEICVYDMTDFSKPPHRILLQDCSIITCMLRVKHQIWVGSKGISQGKLKGKIYVMDAEKKTVEKELVAHIDVVKSLCSAEDRYVLSGSGDQDGKVAIWKVE
ncbi:DENN domain-containing protein 3 [Bufo bufo]|uniref:DENN domain-containing protein 3 n=1 Tax=Bufo bufo TaxID=8384 RepID=UPI001ABE11F3|nr:DENN domain-containing protein 3 [Bufo bufo]XP_040288163.1 DENN domain-containing protein 3 [Bufo bufo]XP_040288164.1 DENN domain-containing protein 3 [Bufo bufo]